MLPDKADASSGSHISSTDPYCVVHRSVDVYILFEHLSNMPLLDAPSGDRHARASAAGTDDVKFARLLSQDGEIGEIAREIKVIEIKFDEITNRVRRFLAK